ncbi:MAG: sensor histidine kinase [Hydrococcus sp. Prado102]|nr:sensor histidine kinase [Hydrococcus sp. Prado102]
MKDFSQLLTKKTDDITQQWIDAVIQDKNIKSTKNLSIEGVKDRISDVLNALVTVLAQDRKNDLKTIAEASIHHGILRAEQNFDPAEVVREYHLLRSLILENLQEGMMQGTAQEVFRAVSLINQVVDAAIAQCFQSYVEERLQELQQLQNQLSLTVEELKRLVRVSQDNLSFLAHEFKTPLTSIIGYSDLYLRQSKQSQIRDTVPSLEHIERVLNNGRQLLRLINDALEFCRDRQGMLKLQLSPVKVRTVVRTVVEVMQPLADSRGLKLVVDCENAPVEVTTDPFRLQQMVMNLVSNAIRYTETGSVTIECRLLSDREWSIAVQDTGIGIAPEDQIRLFKPFERAKTFDGNRPPDSTGLGLAIVDKLVTLLQGRIYIASQPGEGSTFKVILPLNLNTPFS